MGNETRVRYYRLATQRALWRTFVFFQTTNRGVQSSNLFGRASPAFNLVFRKKAHRLFVGSGDALFF
jgi:hypothetical protein